MHDDSAFCVHEHTVAVAVLAGGDVIVRALVTGADDLTAGEALQCDHGRQILGDRDVAGRIRGERRAAIGRRHDADQDQRPYRGLDAAEAGAAFGTCAAGTGAAPTTAGGCGALVWVTFV